jgi:hypothetical protein
MTRKKGTFLNALEVLASQSNSNSILSLLFFTLSLFLSWVHWECAYCCLLRIKFINKIQILEFMDLIRFDRSMESQNEIFEKKAIVVGLACKQKNDFLDIMEILCLYLFRHANSFKIKYYYVIVNTVLSIMKNQADFTSKENFMKMVY